MTTVCARRSRGTGVQNAPIFLRWRPAVALTSRISGAIGPAHIVRKILVVGDSATGTATAFAVALFDFFPRIWTNYTEGFVEALPFPVAVFEGRFRRLRVQK